MKIAHSAHQSDFIAVISFKCISSELKPGKDWKVKEQKYVV